ncbi:MAG: cytochrome c [Chromatiaceae bacterium]|jgi:mono/diheme cytochrome c family protein|nr:cytochrome c [Chromatiaceae bacterium]
MQRVVVLSTIAFFFLSLSGMRPAQAVSLGEAKYEADCAVCHGVTGKGDGPFAESLKKGVPSLTMLRRNNDGVFPFERVYELIDGRKEVPGHGTREMPIWGNRYAAESLKIHDPFIGRWYAEQIIRTRILALVEYIASLQE